MKAFTLERYGEPLTLRDVPDPAPGPDDVIVKVRACGICGTDLKIANGALSSIIRLPHVPGHEISGEIVDVGEAVKNVRIGDRGSVYFYLACGRCRPCLTGRENICGQIVRLGFEKPGGFAEYVKIPARNFCRSDANLPFESLAVLPDALLTSYHAVKNIGRLREGERILIVGAGGLGIHAIQFARHLGASVAVCDPKPAALSLAAEYGADLLLENISGENAVRLKEWTGGEGLDLVLEGSGRGETFEVSLRALGRGGRLVIMGYSTVTPYRLDSMAMHYNEWSIAGARVGTRKELDEVMDLVERGVISTVISTILPMSQLNAGLALLADGGAPGRIVLKA
ncbi:MAG: zinc-binding dehydrogenase [Rectinemataceae bacterium]